MNDSPITVNTCESERRKINDRILERHDSGVIEGINFAYGPFARTVGFLSLNDYLNRVGWNYYAERQGDGLEWKRLSTGNILLLL